MLKGAFQRAMRFGGSAMIVLLSSFASAGGLGDYLVRFSTNGPDRYSDGTIVGDGECYALVWSPKGFVFSGFNADGTPVSSRDRVVLAAPLAKGGRCPDALFQIPSATYQELEGGEWSVCLVDTRTANGRIAGVAANAPRRVNRWGKVRGEVTFSPVSSLGLLGAAASQASGARALQAGAQASGARAGVLSEVPECARHPRITSFEVAEGVARLMVEDTVSYLTYTISSGDAPDALGEDRSADRVDGDAGKPIAIEADATGAGRFFRVTRAE